MYTFSLSELPVVLQSYDLLLFHRCHETQIFLKLQAKNNNYALLKCRTGKRVFFIQTNNDVH